MVAEMQEMDDPVGSPKNQRMSIKTLILKLVDELVDENGGTGNSKFKNRLILLLWTPFIQLYVTSPTSPHHSILSIECLFKLLG